MQAAHWNSVGDYIPAAVSTVKSRRAPNSCFVPHPAAPLPNTWQHRSIWSYRSTEMGSDWTCFYIWPHWRHCICKISPVSLVAAVYTENCTSVKRIASLLLLSDLVTTACLLLPLLNAGVLATFSFVFSTLKSRHAENVWSSYYVWPWVDYPSSSLVTWKKKWRCDDTCKNSFK